MGWLKKLFGGSPRPGAPQETTTDTFDHDVLDNDLPVVVDFWASWCAPCQVMSGLIDELAPEYLNRVAFYKLNIEYHSEPAAMYGVQSVPTLVMFNQGGEVGRITGAQPIDVLRSLFDRLAAKAQE